MDIIYSEEIEPIHQSMPGTQSHLAKTGPSVAPSRVAGADFDRIGFASVRFGHATVGRVDIDSDVLLLAFVKSAHPSGRWDGRPIRPGDVYVYPPGSRHMSSDRECVEVGVFTMRIEALDESIAALGREPDYAPYQVLSGPIADAWARTYDAIMSGPTRAATAAGAALDDLAARSLSMGPTRERNTPGPLATDRRIIALVEDHVRGTDDWRASLLELSIATGFSDRRIQMAFNHVYDVTPHEWMRGRALSAVRTRLTDLAPGDSVSRIAMDHGFEHLGRFAQYYRAAFGELPSLTAATR